MEKRQRKTRHRLARERDRLKATFLHFYRITGWVQKAAELARIKPARHTKWLQTDPLYKMAFEDAEVPALQTLENEAYRRAFDGVEKPIGWYKGEPGGYIREYDSTLLMFLLKARAPEKYREHYTVDHNVRTWEDVVFRVSREDGKDVPEAEVVEEEETRTLQ